MLHEALGIVLRFVSDSPPEANGQVDRVDMKIKASIHRFVLLNPNSNWFAWLLEILVGLHMVLYGSHRYSLFVLTYKKAPFLPAHPLNQDWMLPISFGTVS